MHGGTCGRCGAKEYTTRFVEPPLKPQPQFSYRQRGILLCADCALHHYFDADVQAQMRAIEVDADSEIVYSLPDPNSEPEIVEETTFEPDRARPWWRKFW